MSPLARPLLALAAAALLAAAAGARGPAPRPAPRSALRPAHRDNSLAHPLHNKPNCKKIVIESPYLPPNLDPSLKLTITVSGSHYPSVHGPLAELTDFCSMIVTTGPLGPVGYNLVAEEVTACSSTGTPNLSALGDHVFSPVSAVCNLRESTCEPIELTTVQTCTTGYL